MVIIQLGDSTPLQVTIEGTGRVEACIRENITYTCNVPDGVHIWDAPSYRLVPVSPDVVTSRYIIRAVSIDGVNIISSLTVLSDVGFNNTNVTCTNIHGGEVQQILAKVLGKKGFTGK